MKELEDQPWFPRMLRNFQTDYIGFLVVRTRMYEAFITHVEALALRPQPVVDLCSGSGEPAISIAHSTDRFTHLTLSDKYPNRSWSGREGLSYHGRSTDALQHRFEPGRCYTMFNALHHFSDAEKVEIVQRITTAGATAFLVEPLEPTVQCFLKVLFATTFGCLFLTLLIRPVSIIRLFFTYLVPINIVTITFDGLVSVLRSRSADRYAALFRALGPQVSVHRLATGRSPLVMVQVVPGP